MQSAKSTFLAQVLFYITSIFMFALPVLILFMVIQNPLSPETAAMVFPDINILAPPPKLALYAVFAFNLLGICVLIWILSQMRKLFDQYRKGNALTLRAAGHIRQIGSGLLALAILRLFTLPITSVLLTMSNPENSRELSVALGDSEIGFLLAGGLITLIGWAMHDAAHIAEENKGFV
ncbi:DUF2975 domain-containing protein [Aestuariibius sp. HNIBRBA575]|uniref:DUF2975 domain-containing protein n=1 Tax=Aestuariibius sp. HNIBRBA575 TaxID=3233343 RepID=UPI0034A5B46E